MNADLKQAFGQIKPICDMVMVNPTPNNILAFSVLACELKKESLQDLQQYMLFPIITHLQSKEIDGRYELQRLLANAMKEVLQRIQVTSFEMCVRVEMSLAKLAFDKNMPGMIADIPEELKLSIMQCLLALMLNLETPLRVKMIQSHTPLLAQAVFVSVHMAKTEKLRPLKLTALECLMAHTCTHPKLTNSDYMILEPVLEQAVVNMLCAILPGVLATLQDVAMCPNNPGHAVIVMALNATHRILCMTMNDKHLKGTGDISVADFMRVVKLKDKQKHVSEGKTCDIPKLSTEWFNMAGEKLEAVIRSLVRLVSHEHHKVRKELAVLCYRVITECNNTMQPSIAMCLDTLISLSDDPYRSVGEYCARARGQYFSSERALSAMDGVAHSLFTALRSLPRVLNNIDSSHKVSSLRLLHGYIVVLRDTRRPQRLSTLLASHAGYTPLCDSLLAAAALQADLALLNRHAVRDVAVDPPLDSPWCKFRHLDSPECEARFRDVCVALGEAECAQLVLDTLLDTFRERRAPELVYLMNWIAVAPNSSPSLAQRLIDVYIEEDLWSVPLEVRHDEPALTREDTLDVSVYNPRAWLKDSVPGLFEGATEIRYTDISYQTPRVRESNPDACRTLREAQHNMALCCLLTEGVGMMARRLQGGFQPYLLKTLCLVLERAGSRYEMLHLAGAKALNDIKGAGGHATVGELIALNADYFTHQLTRRLKKAWNTQAALEILSVVMEYSDITILDYLYGIVEDVLVQSCDKYYQKNLYSYLQVFHTFVSCIHKWFPPQEAKTEENTSIEIDVLEDVYEYIKHERESERLMSESEIEDKSVDEMYKEDVEKKEDGTLDYDDGVTQETPPLPQHVKVTKTILKRCINFIPTKKRDDAILAIQVIGLGLPVLKDYEDELLPLVHLTWGPLVTRFEHADISVVTSALGLVVTLAELSEDFIRQRTVKEVLPRLYALLSRLAQESRLKDSGAAYRLAAPYRLQGAALAALRPLATRLRLRRAELDAAMDAAGLYLSRKQPMPLQALAIQFFKSVLSYDYGCAWLHLRRFCANDAVLRPPGAGLVALAAITGTPHETNNEDFDQNIKAIFE